MIYKKYGKYIFLLILLLALVGCNLLPTAKRGSEAFTGTEGIVMNFLPNRPPDKIIADATQLEIPIMIEVRNRGAFPSSEERAFDRWNENDIIFVSGFDPILFLDWKVDDRSEDTPKALIGRRSLDGKGPLNPEGGYDTIEFVGTLYVDNLKIDRFKPSFLVTACYHYFTRANPTICIDPEPYSLTGEKKVCQVEDITLSSQGAPIAITKVEEEILKESIQFRIHFKNLGNGEVIKLDSLNKCSPDSDEILDRKDIDLVKISNVRVSGGSITGSCKPTDQGYVRLFENEGFVICSMPKRDDVKTAYNTPLFIELEYGYRTSISKTVEIINVPTG